MVYRHNKGNTWNLPSFGTVSILFGVVLIAITAMQWTLIESFTPFCFGPILLAMWAFLGLLILASIVYVPIEFAEDPAKAFIPLAINIAVLLIIWFVPFTSIHLDSEFSSNWNDYNEVVKSVEEGEISPDDQGHVLLPQEYRHLSKGGGEIMIDTSDGVTRVFFFTFRGVLDNYSGVMYRSDDKPPQSGDFGEDWEQVVQKRPHWFFCASN